jgi:hypothetical protein
MDEYEWKQQYLERLTDLGFSQTEAVSMMQHRFGRRHIDTDNCPRCAANAELFERAQLDRDELARLRAENAELLDWVRVVGEETVLAGYPGGDRAQTLKNLRTMRAEIAALRADSERYKWLLQWLQQQHLLTPRWCQPAADERCARWWILQEAAFIKGDSCIGYGNGPESAIDAARKEDV